MIRTSMFRGYSCEIPQLKVSLRSKVTISMPMFLRSLERERDALQHDLDEAHLRITILACPFSNPIIPTYVMSISNIIFESASDIMR